MKKGIALLFGLFVLIIVGYTVYVKNRGIVEEIRIPDTTSMRETIYGNLVGFKEDNNVHGWRGIPYAASPPGELRWKAPRSPDKWEGIREAIENGSICSQIGGLLGGVPKDQFDKPVGSEDCLYLNIWAPVFSRKDVPKGGKRLPVMFWIHGGGNSIGQGSSYNGKVLAEKYNVVIVTINYRLGPFGWFSHPALNKTNSSIEDRSGNYGTLDIIKALSWVNQNFHTYICIPVCAVF